MNRSHSGERAEAQDGGQQQDAHNSVGHEIDRYRSIVFPNAVRELRKQHGFAKLLGLSVLIVDIPYVRLSKIERGEVFAKTDELRRIAAALKVEPERLLVDVEAPGFDIAEWAADLQDWTATDLQEDRFAVELAAALRHKRESDKSLSIAAIEQRYGIAPVILSRLENAFKTLDRWNAQTVRAVCALMGVPDVRALRKHVAELIASGVLASPLDLIANPAIRIEKTRARMTALREELADGGAAARKAAQPRRVPATGEDDGTAPLIAAIRAADMATVRLVPVFGSPLLDGLIDRTATGEVVEAPRRAGPRAYGLRVGRPTLGPALPGHATVVVDPDRFPSSGGIAVVREEGGLRLLIVSFDRQGRMIGYSINPDREVPLDAVDPADVAMVVSVALD
jgi:transcriptional regulator with XRE-family HTH domain